MDSTSERIPISAVASQAGGSRMAETQQPRGGDGLQSLGDTVGRDQYKTLPTGTPVTVAQSRKQTSGDDCDAVENNQAASWTKATGQMNTQYTDRNDTDNNKKQPGMPQHATQNSQQNLLPSSSLATLQPYEDNQGFAAANTKNKIHRQRRNKQTKVKRLLLINSSNPESNHFTKFYSVKFPRLDLDAKLNVIATDKDLKMKIGNPASIKKQSKDTLLIEVKSDAQGGKLKNITALHGQPVEVAEHKTLNTCKGTVYSETMSNSSLEELQDALKDQQVSKVERMKRRVNGVLKDTHRHIITFNKPDLPQVIKITDWHHELIDLFIPNPMRCMNCKRLGHTKKWCRRTSPTCSKCAEEHHPALGCDKPLRCVNCSEEHNALERKCPFYQFKCEVLATQTRKRISFPEAEEEVKERFRQNGKQSRFVSYVSKVRKDAQNREVAQNETGGQDVEMSSGSPDGPQQIPTEQTAREEEPETPNSIIAVPKVRPEPQQTPKDNQQAASDETVVAEVQHVHGMDSQIGKNPEPPKTKTDGQKPKNEAPGHRPTKPDPSGAIPKQPKKKTKRNVANKRPHEHNKTPLEETQSLFQDAHKAPTGEEQNDVMDDFFTNISEHSDKLGRKRLLESVSPPSTTNKKEKANEAEKTAHVETEKMDRSEAPEPEPENQNLIPVLGTSASRAYQDKDSTNNHESLSGWQHSY